MYKQSPTYPFDIGQNQRQTTEVKTKTGTLKKKKKKNRQSSILDYICDDCSAHFEKVKSLLDIAGVKYEVDAGIVRGLDYYTRTVFEFVQQQTDLLVGTRAQKSWL